MYPRGEEKCEKGTEELLLLYKGVREIFVEEERGCTSTLLKESPEVEGSKGGPKQRT